MKKIFDGAAILVFAVILAGLGYWIFAPGIDSTPKAVQRTPASVASAESTQTAPKSVTPRVAAPAIPPVSATTDTPTSNNPPLNEPVPQPLTRTDTQTATNQTPPAMTTADLGEVAFTDGLAQNFILADGSQAAITPHVLPDGNLSLDIVVEGTSPNGGASRSQVRVMSQPGQTIQMGLRGRTGGMALSLTPKLTDR